MKKFATKKKYIVHFGWDAFTLTDFSNKPDNCCESGIVSVTLFKYLLSSSRLPMPTRKVTVPICRGGTWCKTFETMLCWKEKMFEEKGTFSKYKVSFQWPVNDKQTSYLDVKYALFSNVVFTFARTRKQVVCTMH